MRLDPKIFKSRLAWRFFGMFVACALIPILALAVVSYVRVTRQLEDQALDRLRQSAKSHTLWIYERVVLADHQLQAIQELPSNKLSSTLPPAISERNRELFTGLVLLCKGKTGLPLGGGIPAAFEETVRRITLNNGDVRLVTLENKAGWPTVALVRRMQGRHEGECYLAGVIDPVFLWGIGKGTLLPPGTEFLVWDEQGRSLFSSLGRPVLRDENLLRQYRDGMPRGKIEMTIGHERYHAFMWSVFTKPRFQVPFWTVMVLEPQNQIFAPLHFFRIIFFAVVLLSLLVTVWLSSRAIRKSLVPIDTLMEGARHVADQDFTHRVVVESKDEFRDLAEAFNRMTHHLDRQFRTLVARSDMDIAILSVLDLEQIVETSLKESGLFFAHKTAAISALATDDRLSGRSYLQGKGEENSKPIAASFRLSSEDYTLFERNVTWQEFSLGDSTPAYLGVLYSYDVLSYIVFPIKVRDRLFALVSFGLGAEDVHSQQELEQVRGFCNHLAVAFSNSDLIRELKELNMGTLLALARTVDAKSPWTAGHSARVAQMAADIGEAMGLPKKLVEDLQSASLLHDIGKIGVPSSLLNKAGKLTGEEYEIIKAHPVLGALILAPIKVYAGIIPIVEQHHERYDGAGYPHGIAGDQIDLSARVMAVADSFDAMVSDRPYRRGLSETQAVDIIDREKGHQFDPLVVEAFREVMSRRKVSLTRSAPPLVFPEIRAFHVSSLDSAEKRPVDIPVKS